MAISGLYWVLVTLIDIYTTSQFMARDAHAWATVLLALRSPIMPIVPAAGPEDIDRTTEAVAVSAFPDPVMALCPNALPIIFFNLTPDDSVRRWLTTALTIAITGTMQEPDGEGDVLVLPKVQAAPTSKASAPVPKARKGNKSTDTQKTRTPRKPLPRTTAS